MKRSRSRTYALYLTVLALAVLSFPVHAEEDRTFFQWGYNPEFYEEDEIPYDMRLPDWNSEDGNMREEVLVAVVDGGIDYRHPDLQGKIYEFSEEEQAALGCGRYGYDAVTGDTSDPPPDLHGTHVAGIIGASWNGEGTSGAASNVRFISINVGEGDHTPVEYTLRAYDFILRAVDYGLPIRLVNNSWGNVDSSLAMLPLIEEAGEKGVLSFFSAGNDASDLEHSIFYPVMYLHDSPYVVVIGAHTWEGDNASYSNYGQSAADVFAPGSEILSTVSGYAGGNYSYRSGTSMASPAACGACAVLAAAHPEVTDAAELKTLFLSCTRPTEALADIGANGIVDLSVEERGDRNPVITNILADGADLTIEGAFFGTEGTVTVTDPYDASKIFAIAEDSLRWGADRICLTLAEAPAGLVRVRVQERICGKYDSQLVLTANSPAVFDRTLSLPEDFGERDVFDAMPDYQAAGFLGGQGNYLYYLPLRFVEENGILAFEQLFRYDITRDTWTELSPLPERVAATQGTFFQGMLCVAGTDRNNADSLFLYYDPETDSWQDLPLDKPFMPSRSSAVNCDGDLLLVGGYHSRPFTANNLLSEYCLYDPGLMENLLDGKLAAPVFDAVSCYADGNLYVYGSTYAERDEIRPVLQRLSGTTAQTLPDAFPELFEAEGLRRGDFSPALHGAFAACDEGLLWTGALSADGQTDTWILKHDATRFTPLTRRVSDADVFWPACTVHEGVFYVIGRSHFEEGHQVFRAIALSDLLE